MEAVHSKTLTEREIRWIPVMVFAYLLLLADGIDFLYLALSLTSLKHDFGLTDVQAGSFGSASLAAMLVGGIVGGWACDRYGRVRSLVVATVIFSLGTSCLGFTQDYWQFLLIRFIGSLGIGAVYVGANTLVFEYAPVKHRTTVLGTLQSGWTVGYVVASVLAGAILPHYGWRYLFFTSAVPVVLAIFMHAFIRDSDAYLEAKRKREAEARSGAGKQPSILRSIFDNPEQRQRFIVWTIGATLLQFAYYGVVNWIPAYLQSQMHISFSSIAGFLIATFIASTFAKIAAGWLADRIGRRLMFFLASALTAVFIPIVVLYKTPDNILYLMTIFGFFYGMPYGVTATFMSESFPTDVRGSASGTAYNIGRLGGVLAPVTIGYLSAAGHIDAGFMLMAVAFLACGLVPALLIRGKTY
ncbi:MFS transporter [Paraburkholderia sp. J10-1]|uniref:MFS transporter n=1 Tax=Paraburkholderia sp. J10-1 TaxID=2805430 RepID=UPI002AB765C2|nr:MFS transporter [Paraburkholderia sp. J10-1]